MKFIAAWRFLTVIPFPWQREVTPEEIGGSLVYFPVIGLIIGLTLAGLAWVFRLLLPQAVVGVIAVISALLVTGAIHLDGLSDTFDGFGGSTAEERLRIMRDSRSGSFGVAAIVCILLLEVISLIVLPQTRFLQVLILMPVAGRAAMVYAVNAFPYARPSGLGRLFKEKTNVYSSIVAAVFALAVAALLFQWAGLVTMILAFGIVTGVAFFFKRRSGGLTGDVYGAINEITEVAILVMVVVLVNKNWLGI